MADLDRVRSAVEHLLDDELRRRRCMHEAVAAETRRDVEAGDTWHRADDRMIVGRHFVIAGPRVHDPQIREGRMPPRRARTHPWFERRGDLEWRELARKSHRRTRGSLLFLAIGGDVRHREALSGALRSKVEARLPLDRQGNARELRHGT